MKLKHMRALVRGFWGSIILLVLVVAVCVQLGREAFPMLNDYRGLIGEKISAALGVEVDIGAIEARWVGLRPHVEFSHVSMYAVDGEKILDVGKVEGELSLISSLRAWKLVWRQLEFSRLNMQFEQGDNGRWNLGGLSLTRPRVADPTAITDPLDIFLSGRHLTLNQSTFQFAFRTGHEAELSVPQLVLENEADFHRLVANFAVDDDSEAFAVVIEGHGNPRLEDNFTAEGYVALENFPMEKIVAALDIEAWDAASEGQWSEGHRLDTSLWFSGNPYREMSLKGRIRADGLPLKVPGEVQLPAGLRAQLTGQWQFAKGWRLALHEAEIPWQDVSSPPFNLVLTGGANQPLSAAIDEIDLSEWYQLAETAGLLRGKFGEVITAVAPAGKLTNVHLIKRTAEQGHFGLRANLRELGTNAYRAAPAVESLDGYIEASAQSGRLVVDSQDGFSMFYPKIFNQSMAYARASGELRWAVREELQRVEVSSGLLSLSGEEGEGRGYMHLELPYGEYREEPRMTLLIGLRDSDARFHQKYVPYKLPASLYDWLQNSIKGGQVSHAGFLLHGSLAKNTETLRAVQLFGHADQAELQFNPDWPALREAEGWLLLDNKDVDVEISRGKIGGNRLHQTRVTLRPVPDVQSPLLQIKGRTDGDLEDVLRLLRDSPIGTYLGKGFADWRGTGRVTADMNLQVPLRQGITGGNHQVRAQLHGNQLTLPELNLTLEQITGPLNYSTALGLNTDASSLSLNLWGREASVGLSSSQGQDKPTELQIDFSGSALVERLAEWIKRPELTRIADGDMQLEGRISLPLQDRARKAVRLEASSDLTGVGIALPAPYGKAAQDKQQLSLKMNLLKGQRYALAYGDLLRLQFELEERLQALSLVFGNQFEPLERGYIDLSGHAGLLDLQIWKPVLEKFLGAQGANSGGLALGVLHTGSLVPRFDLHLNKLQLEQFSLEQLYLSGDYANNRWRVDVSSPHVNGEVKIFDNGQPLQVDLTSLSLPATGEEGARRSRDDAEAPPESPVGFLKGISVSRLPPMDFSTRSLTSADTDYGAWSFNLRPIDGGIVLHNLHGAVKGLTLGSGQSADPAAGAELVWLQSQERSSTYFNGQFRSGNLGAALRELGQAKLLESESARFDLELLWPGAPDEINLRRIAGAIDMDIRKGRFIRGAEAGNNPLWRLLGLLNFDTLARRLRMDFSDLYKEGMAFDSVVGHLRFDQGQILVDEPLRVATPSATLQFAGVLDARAEQVDATLVATLPVTGNLAVAAAFVGGLPAAVSVYVVGQLFKEQVDKASSIRYRINGPWEDPSIRVDKIFESSTAAAQQRAQAQPGSDEVGEGTPITRRWGPDQDVIIGNPTRRLPPQH